MTNKKTPIKAELIEGMRVLYDDNSEVLVVSICTTDGFPIKSFSSNDVKTETDKLAAMSSTIAALSGSSAKEILSDRFNLTIIETDSGNLLFVRTNYLGLACVLSIATQIKMALGTARYKTKMLAQSIDRILP